MARVMARGFLLESPSAQRAKTIPHQLGDTGARASQGVALARPYVLYHVRFPLLGRATPASRRGEAVDVRVGHVAYALGSRINR